LAQENEYATDALILSLTRIHWAADRYHKMFAETVSPSSTERIPLIEIESRLYAAKTSLSTMINELPSVLRQSALADLAYNQALMHVYEADLINPLNLRHNHEILVSDEEMAIIILKHCLQAIKDLFETFFTIPASEYPLLSSHQWMAVGHAVLLLYKLSLGIARVPGWDVQIAWTTAPFGEYMEQCCKSMAFAHRVVCADTSNQTGPRKDLYSLQAAIWQDVLDEFLRKKDLPWEERTVSTSNFVHRKALGGHVEGQGGNHAILAGGKRVVHNGEHRSKHPCPA
jgi:hypothetical protein